MVRTGVILASLLVLAGRGAAQEPCTITTNAAATSRDLYCIELLPTAVAEAASGTAQLDWPGGPFTVAVAPDGTHRWRITLRLSGLPPLRGARAGYVAWAAPPSMAEFVRLGAVRNGLTRAGELAFDRFTILVSAETDARTTTRRGRVVLRGESASHRLRPADVYQFFLGSLPPRGGDSHAHHAGGRDSSGWSTVPMYPGLDMLPSEMALRPTVGAWSPPDDPAAPVARPRQILRLRSGDTLDLSAGTVRRTIAGRAYTMFAFNGQYPGPLLQVEQSAQITVRFSNRLPLPSAVHWHGLRLDNRFDGAVGVTQPEVPPGGSFTYVLRFPDAGIYWYHPHVREDVQQDLGLYGNIFVRPADPLIYGRADREEFLILDDILIGDDGLVPWGLDAPTHAAMGRFGNQLLVNGETGWNLTVDQGGVVRFYLTNASNTRTFNASFGRGARMKLVGSDLGPYAREEWVESIVIAPAERYIVDVRFDSAGAVPFLNRVRAIDHLYGNFFSRTDTLGVVGVSSKPFADLLPTPPARTPRDFSAFLAESSRAVRRTLELRVAFTGLPFVTDQLMRLDSIFFNPVEWDGTMPGMNWSVTGREARWILRDSASGAENMDVSWRFKVGDVLKLRLVGARDVLHGMQHPMHLHGQRFLVLDVNGIRNQNPVWKDTVLLPAGTTVTVLVEMSNPGRWMLHCHIAEHLQSGMMMVLDVEAP